MVACARLWIKGPARQKFKKIKREETTDEDMEREQYYRSLAPCQVALSWSVCMYTTLTDDTTWDVCPLV